MSIKALLRAAYLRMRISSAEKGVAGLKAQALKDQDQIASDEAWIEAARVEVALIERGSATHQPMKVPQ